MHNFIRKIALIGALTFPALASANPIVIEVLPDGGGTPGSLGGFDLTSFADPEIPNSGCGPYSDGVTSVDSPISGQVDFYSDPGIDEGGSPLCMSVRTIGDDVANGEIDWWEWEHGNVFTTHEHWVQLVMPEDTRAFTFYVGASFWGRGWIEATDDMGNTAITYFNGDAPLGPGSTPGFGAYTTGACSAITRIIIEPTEWGTGEFAINQDACTTVPEPGTLALLGIGLLGLALTRRRWDLRKEMVKAG